MIVAVQQPEHMPWLGFFDKMASCDRFVLLDNVQFKKRYFENRNKIRDEHGEKWITVPVISKGRYTQLIRDVELDNTTGWSGKYWPSVRHAYARASCFERYAPVLEPLLRREWGRLVDLNLALIDALREMLGIDTETVRASNVVDEGQAGSALLLEICRRLGATSYMSGPDGRSYLDLESFDAAGIDVRFHDYRHPTYTQIHAPFVSHLSVIDLIFNHGERSLEILTNRLSA